MGEAWGYVQEIYKRLKKAGYKVHHWLLKGENMGVPQTRHRVFFVGIRNDLGVDPVDLDMSFYYEPVRFREIKSGKGGEVGRESLSFRAGALLYDPDRMGGRYTADAHSEDRPIPRRGKDKSQH